MAQESNARDATGASADARRTLAFEDDAHTTLVVTGPDRWTWLNGLVTCDLARPPAERAAYGLAPSQKGRILADVVLVAAGDEAVVVAPRSHAEALKTAWDRYLIMEDAELSAEARAVFFVDAATAADRDAVVSAVRAAGLERAVASPFARTPELESLVVVAKEAERGVVREALGRALEATGGTWASASAWEASRVARGLPKFGADFGESTYPQEAGLERSAVSFNKGCYLGQEVICMLEMRGQVKRRLVRLAIDLAATDPRPEPGTKITADGEGGALGELTSVAPPDEARGGGGGGADAADARVVANALGMVKRTSAEAGVVVRVGGSTARIVGIA